MFENRQNGKYIIAFSNGQTTLYHYRNLMQIIVRVFLQIKFGQEVRTIYDCFIIVPKKLKTEKLEHSEILKKITRILTVHFCSSAEEDDLESFANKLSVLNGILSGIY